ncbi:hypothetical protein GCK72_019234 [Caenorhabditis remanei]|uniref:Uncharacterized protein n=1 Tax=Caenorhabditis remanei TaxID=31234 RepID=A0A6A5GE23_CAERE|nr:hypothetical protein GCK72_019234 [Caenorhabditis remanei]KAF1752679.1 hypothetical protein GCK72_019234 [Caenorhabditis remanei]
MNLTWPDYIESNCRQNYSFFCTTDYLRNAYHCTALISVTLSLFTFYAIIRVTPPRLKNMKTPLLITHAWSTNLDLMLTVYSAPMVFFPSASGIPLGIFGSLGIPVKWQAYWGQVSIFSYNNNSMLLMAFHGILSTTCTLLIYQPYRDLIKHIIFGKKEDEDRRTSMATASYIGKGRRSTGTRIVPPVETSI